MQEPRPTRWRRRDARRRSSIRRLLLAGAVAGLALGLIAQVAVHETIDGTDIEPLVRLALVLPAFVFLLWWLLFPGLSIDEPAEPVALAPIDPEERLDRIEATFDTAAVPRARRHELEQVDGAAHRTYRATIRRDEDQATVDPNSFGIRRPEVPAQDTAS